MYFPWSGWLQFLRGSAQEDATMPNTKSPAVRSAMCFFQFMVKIKDLGGFMQKGVARWPAIRSTSPPLSIKKGPEPQSTPFI
jgi:hypothetical protein